MREEIQRFHSLTLQTHNAILFESLIYPHNITTESAKSYQFEDKEGLELARQLRGYFAMKDVDGKKSKFFIEEQYYHDLPIRVNQYEEIFYKDSARAKSIVIRPTDITPFRIKPQKCWEENHQFIDEIAPFNHSMPDYWTLAKLIAIQSYIGKTFTGICSLSEFGKSSVYLVLDALTKKCPVFQPRSVPGVLAQITGDGNMIFDEVHDAPSEVKSCMENFSLQVAGNSPVYINGAMKSQNTKPKYDVSQQSITFLYNVYSNYKDPEKQFWNNIWANRKAMESRFLCMKLEGKLLEEFDKDFNIPKVAEENKMFYIKIAKHLLYLKQIKLSNKYKRRYCINHELDLKGRHKIIYDELVWLVDLYSNTHDEFNKFVDLVNDSINNYQTMIMQQPFRIANYSGEPVANTKEVPISTNLVVEEETIIETPEQKIMNCLIENKLMLITELEEKVKIENFEKILDKMKSRGDIFYPSPGKVCKL